MLTNTYKRKRNQEVLLFPGLHSATNQRFVIFHGSLFIRTSTIRIFDELDSFLASTFFELGLYFLFFTFNKLLLFGHLCKAIASGAFVVWFDNLPESKHHFDGFLQTTASLKHNGDPGTWLNCIKEPGPNDSGSKISRFRCGTLHGLILYLPEIQTIITKTIRQTTKLMDEMKFEKFTLKMEKCVRKHFRGWLLNLNATTNLQSKYNISIN